MRTYIFGMRCLLLLIGTMSALACRDPVAVTFPPHAVRLAGPPPAFRGWWEVVEGCSGLAGPFDSVEWYSTPPATLTSRGRNAVGAWFRDGNRVVISTSWMDHGPLVRHEMLHAILQTGSHPAEFFERKCGDELIREFVDATAPVPFPEAVNVSVDVLGAEATLFPRSLSLQEQNGHATVVVRVHNPTTRAVFVPAGIFGESRCGVGYLITSLTTPSWTKWECSYLDSAGDSRVYFAPGQTRRLVFEARLVPTSGPRIHPGEVLVSAVVTDNIRRTDRTTLLP